MLSSPNCSLPYHCIELSYYRIIIVLSYHTHIIITKYSFNVSIPSYQNTYQGQPCLLLTPLVKLIKLPITIPFELSYHHIIIISSSHQMIIISSPALIGVDTISKVDHTAHYHTICNIIPSPSSYHHHFIITQNDYHIINHP